MTEPALSNRLFARRAALIAQRASSWVSQSLEPDIDLAAPVPLDVAKRFAEEIRRTVDLILRDAEAASKRGTGRTTQQMRDAPYGACFVWCTEQLGYPRRLAMWLQRGDLTIIPPSQDLDDFHRGTTWAVVRDHACSH